METTEYLRQEISHTLRALQTTGISRRTTDALTEKLDSLENALADIDGGEVNSPATADDSAEGDGFFSEESAFGTARSRESS